MKKASVFNKVLSVLLVITLILSLAVPGLAAQTGVSFKKVSNNSVSAKLPGRDAADLTENEDAYADTDVVRVSIVLDKAGTLEAGYKASAVSSSFLAKLYRNGLKRDQANVTGKIEKATKQELDVVWNLTLAANIISANVAYGQIETIEAVNGVAEVLIETQYAPDVVSTGAADPNMATSGKQIGSAPAWAAGYTGAGSRIAIIDTGVDIDHQSFSAAAFEASLMYNAGKAGMSLAEYKEALGLLTAAEIDNVAAELNVPVTGADAYINSKIPFGYNYVDGDYDVTHDNDGQGSHGSHVSGIAAANAYIPSGDGFVAALESAMVQGVAPDAQLITMKVFGKTGGAYDSDYMAAIEDAVLLGADSVNLSLGSGNPGRSRNSNAEYQAILDSLADSGVVVAMSAGNSGYWAEADYNMGYLYADDVSMHTGGSPGSFTNSLGVASVDNDGKTGLYFTVGDSMVVYNETEYSNEPFSTLAGEQEYVIIDGIGSAEEWAAVGEALVGKIAICSRGEISFFEKAVYAVEAGAIGTFIYNNDAGIINMDLSDYPYTEPCASLTQADGLAIMAASTPVADEAGNVLYYTGTMTISETMGAGQFNSPYYTMSSFSSWGVPQSLLLKPEITAPGGSIYSVNGVDKSGTAYEVMSGTSMASPQVAGMAAVLAQYIKEAGLEAATGLTARQLAQSLLMSTAVPMLDATYSYYPVIQQGAGLGNVGAAVLADTYILMNADATESYADGKVKAELGDDPDKTGKYEFSFTINNLEDVEKLYNLSADFFIQAPTSDGVDMYMYTATTLIGALTTFTVDGEEVGAIWDMDGADYNGDGAVNVLDGQALLDYATGVRTELTNEDKADLDADGDIDSYDAYLFLAKAESLATVPAGGSVEVTVNVTIPDDWKSTIDYYYPNGTYIQGYVYADGVSSEEGVMGTSHSIPVLGFYGNWSDASMYEKGSALEYAHGEETRAPYLGNTDANAFTVVYGNEPGTQYLFGGNPLVPDATYMPERNAISAANGDKIGKISFTAIRNAAASLYYVEDLTNGALLDYALPGAVDSAYYYVNGGVWRNTGYSLNIGFSPAGLEEGTQLELGLTLAPEYYVDAEGNVAWDALGEGATFSIPMVVDNTAPTLEDVSLSLTGKTLTVTAYDNQYIAAVALYNKKGTQVMAYTGAKQDIAPEESAAYVLDLSEVKGSKFLLQVMDYAMNTTTYEINLGGEDEPVVLPDRIAFDLDDNFWTSFDKTYTYQDIVEYAPSDYTYFAGTIVDEYAFAATDEGVLHVMPLEDLTDVTVVADLGAVVTDMAYNKADGKIYGVASGYLITIDKLNGQIAIVGEVGVLTNTLACDANGTFYCNEYGTGNVYSFTLDTVAEPTLLTTVVEVESQYVQAMEIDPNTGMLCWNSYYMFSFMGYTFGFSYYYEIDTATGEYTEYEDLWDELSALMIPDKSSGGNWSDPTDKVTGIQINPSAASLLRGETLALTASVQPWTATDRTVTWTSDNEAVATVDEDGVVTAVDAGTATITATSNLDPSFSATCAVTVSTLDVTIHGTLQDEEDNSMFYDWNLAEDETWTGGAAIDTSMTSATVDTLNNKVYIMDAVSNVWNMHIVDPETGAIEMTGANGAAVPLWDMEYSTVFSTAEAPKISAIYYYYFLPAKDPMALDTSAFGLSSYLSQYSGASWLVAIASAGYEVVGDLETGEPIETEHVMMLDNAGYIWDFWIYPTDSGFSAQLNFAPTNLADLGVEFPGDTAGENMYTSMVVGEDGNLYLSAFTGETNELYRLIYDAATESYAAQFIGDVGEGVWPATITSVTVNAAAASDSAAAPKATMKMSSVTVSAEEMAAAKVDTTIAKSADSNKAAKVEMLKAEASEKAETEAVKAPVALQPMMGSAVVDEKEDYVTVTITAGAPELEAAALSEDLYTNGVTTVTWDVESLTLVDIAVNADYTSINEGEGTVTLGYVQLDGYNADDVVATLYFEVKNTDAETVTVVYNEVNNEHPGVEEEVAINYPHANTEVKDAKDATCTEDGYTGDTYCTDCGKLVAKGEVIPATGHGETEIKDAKDATCTEDGYTGDTYCTVCGEKIADGEVIPATGHGETEIKDAKDATCTEDGYTGDTYCTVCGEKIADGEVIPATGHGETEIKDAKDATCTEDGYTGDTYCTVCGEKIADGETVAAKGHNYESVVTKPTVDAEGYTTHTCTDCGHSYVDSYTDKVDPENPKTVETFRNILAASLLVMSVAAVAGLYMINRKKEF